MSWKMATRKKKKYNGRITLRWILTETGSEDGKWMDLALGNSNAEDVKIKLQGAKLLLMWVKWKKIKGDIH
jgi:hypothetical protein